MGRQPRLFGALAAGLDNASRSIKRHVHFFEIRHTLDVELDRWHRPRRRESKHAAVAVNHLVKIEIQRRKMWFVVTLAMLEGTPFEP